MYTPSFALAIAPLLLLARADVGFDRDDVPNACNTICDPIVELSRQCDVDLRSDNDRDENLLEMQCVCTNDSFDVASIAALCADCIRQNQGNSNDDDDDDDDDKNEDLDDISDLMYTCGFASTTYVASASASAQSISVSASRPTDISQLSTTIVPGQTSAGSNSGSSGTATASGSSSTGSSNNDDSSNTTNGGSSATGDSASTTSTDNAAPAVTPFGVAGAVLAGAMMLLA